MMTQVSQNDFLSIVLQPNSTSDYYYEGPMGASRLDEVDLVNTVHLKKFKWKALNEGALTNMQ